MDLEGRLCGLFEVVCRCLFVVERTWSREHRLSYFQHLSALQAANW